MGSHWVPTGGWDGSFTFPTTSTVSAWKPRWVPVPPATLCVGGHSADGEMIRYVDGLYVAYCAHCGERWQFVELPAHDVALRARELLSSVLEDHRSDPETLSQLNEMSADLRRARNDIEAALELLDIVEGLRGDG